MDEPGLPKPHFQLPAGGGAAVCLWPHELAWNGRVERRLAPDCASHRSLRKEIFLKYHSPRQWEDAPEDTSGMDRQILSVTLGRDDDAW
eukprot:gene2998-10621_t